VSTSQLYALKVGITVGYMTSISALTGLASYAITPLPSER
jgi:hypothetical protein